MSFTESLVLSTLYKVKIKVKVKIQIYFSFIGLGYLFFHACNQSFFPQFPVIVPILISIHAWHSINSSLNTVQVLQSNLQTLASTVLVETGFKIYGREGFGEYS